MLEARICSFQKKIARNYFSNINLIEYEQETYITKGPTKQYVLVSSQMQIFVQVQFSCLGPCNSEEEKKGSMQNVSAC